MAAAIVALVFAFGDLGNPAATFTAFFVSCFSTNVFFSATLGLAWHHYAMKRGWHGPHAYVLPALAVGIFVPSIFFGLAMIWSSRPFDPRSDLFSFQIFAALSVPLSGITALLFWLIRRPDRDPPNPDKASP